MLSTIADSGLFGQYSLTGYDEMFAGPGRVRPHYVALHDRLGEMGGEELASRDRVIGDLITNLNQVMVTLGDRDVELSDLLIKLRQFVSGLSQDREAILGSLENISQLAVETADLVSGIRSPFVRDLQQLRRVAGTLDRNKAEIDRALQVLPVKLQKVGRTAIYGSYFNFYLCSFKGNVLLPEVPPELEALGLTLPDNVKFTYNNGEARCDLE